jgi:hypothetical protein
MIQLHKLFTVLLALSAVQALDLRVQRHRFYDDDPLCKEPVTQNVAKTTRYEPDFSYENVVNLFERPGDPVLGQHAKNVNTIDEVPDGPFYVNRAGRIPLTPAMIARGANESDGPAAGQWTIISAKSDGVTPGFTVRDSAGTVWYLKFDPPGFRAMATGSEIVGAKLFWALGYHTTEYHITRLVPSNLVISAGTTITPYRQAKRGMRQSDIKWLLRNADRDSDGSYRVIASKAVPGRYLGRIRFAGTRADDPNDIIPHEHHRELRGYFVFAAWLNHVDAKGINSLVSLVTEGDRTFIRSYLLDFGSILGSAGNGPREGWEGFETVLENPHEILKRVVTFGLRIPEWRRMSFYQTPAIGRVPRDNMSWNPDDWQPHYTNAAFRHARADDKFWAACKLSFITDDMIRAAVAAGQFGDKASEEILEKMIVERKAKILAAYLPAINPIVDPALGADGGLTFRNIAVDNRVAEPPRGYRATWSTFDNETGLSTPLGVTDSTDTALSAPKLPETAFLKVEVSAVGPPVPSWEEPVTLYFRKSIGAWSLVGLERPPD